MLIFFPLGPIFTFKQKDKYKLNLFHKAYFGRNIGFTPKHDLQGFTVNKELYISKCLP
jgi:hypothetical protein